jgi:hypothetical protein
MRKVSTCDILIVKNALIIMRTASRSAAFRVQLSCMFSGNVRCKLPYINFVVLYHTKTGRGADHTHHSRAEVANGLDLHFYISSVTI